MTLASVAGPRIVRSLGTLASACALASIPACGGASGSASATDTASSTSSASTATTDPETDSGGEPTDTDGSEPYSPEWVDIHSVIVRPESFTRSFTGSRTYTERVEAFADAAAAIGVRGVFIELRAVDPSTNNPDQAGHMYFPLADDPAILAADVFVSDMGEDFGADDGALLRALISALHRRGVQAYGWLPVFRDREVYLLGAPYITEPDSYEPDFVSVFDPEVRAHELEVARQAMSRYCFAGLHLDYMRYQAEDQPQEGAASSAFAELYGAPIIEPATAGPDGPLWADYLDFRAEGLRAFAAAAKTTVAAVRRVEVGAFLMPHSLRTTSEAGYSDEPWSGVDYGKLASVGLSLSPMVYWGHSDPGWTDDWMGFTEAVLDNLVAHVDAHSGARALPTYSMAYATEELASALVYARERGIGGVTVFYYGDWLSPDGDPLARLDAAVELGLGPAVYPRVSITSPAAGGAPVPWSSGEFLELEVEVELGAGEPEVADAWARLDGGAWRSLEVGVPGEPIQIAGDAGFDLGGEAPGCHTITVLVRDALGRPGQGVLVLEVSGPPSG